jgi:putative DNA primase/helicase
MVASERKKAGAKEIREALDNGQDAKAVAKRLAAADETEPIRKRYMTNDTTVEKPGVILSQNPNGVLIYRDEWAAFVRLMEREGHEGDRGFYLEAWNGTGRFTCDRIGRGTVEIEAAIVSILGSTQPGPLQDYLRGAVAGGHGDDGLMQRFQLAVWPDVPAHWRNVDPGERVA